MVRKLLSAAILGLVLGLGACASSSNPGNPSYPGVGEVDRKKLEQTADGLRITYAGILHLAAEYVSQPRCGTAGAPPAPGCSSQSAVNEIRRYQAAAGTATKGAQDLAHSAGASTSQIANAIADGQRAIELYRNSVAAFKPQAREVK